MPTKRQLSKMREAEMEYPKIRRSDDPMFNSNSPISNDAKLPVSRSAAFDCNCSIHGRQPMIALLVWAKVKLGCGCIWSRTDGEWRYEGSEP